jgi:hypothetical protein
VVVSTEQELRDRISAALTLHAPECGRCFVPLAECTGHADWRGEYDQHDPTPECPVCVASWAEEATEPWPCATARALGATPEPTTEEIP